MKEHELVGYLTGTEMLADRFGGREASVVITLEGSNRDNILGQVIGSFAPELIGKRVRITIEPAEDAGPEPSRFD
jgi:hypothetical protein